MGCTVSVYDPLLDEQEKYVQDNLQYAKRNTKDHYSDRQLKRQLCKKYE